VTPGLERIGGPNALSLLLKQTLNMGDTRMPRLLSAVAIAGFMALAGSSAQAAPAAGLLDSLKNSDHGLVQQAHWRCWWSHHHRHCRRW